jgi:peptide/nickel transport system ATP-binding protein
MQILPPAARVAGGRIRFRGADLVARGDRRGLTIIFQNPRAALNPIRPIGRQIVDALEVYTDLGRRAAEARAVELLGQVRLRDPGRRFWSYPFELSGGMCQRALIALALACEPTLLIADEPTTGLDVTTQKAIVDLLAELSAARGMAIVLITHDLALAGERCGRLVVMQAGRVVETGPAAAILHRPAHPYTRSLVAAIPGSAGTPAAEQAAGTSTRPLLEVEGLTRIFPLRRQGGLVRRVLAGVSSRAASAGPELLRAVDGVDLWIMPGESVGLVGESGSGKSTLASMIVRLTDPTDGRIHFRGAEIGRIPARRFARRPERRDIQMVFQDPTASLDPRQTALGAIAEPLRRLGPGRTGHAVAAAVEELAAMVGLPGRLLPRLPHQLSGGEKARVGIARAIALRPSLLVLDEPTAALDVRVQAVVLDLLAELRRTLGMSYLFVSHDLTVVRRLCDRVLVMQAGRIVDGGPTRTLLTTPTHAYTQGLLAAIPRPPTLAEERREVCRPALPSARRV